MNRRSAIVLLIAASTLLSSQADATHLDVADGNDTRGRLDIKKVASYGSPPVWNIKTYRGWGRKKLFEKGFFLVFFDTRGKGNRFEYYALVYSDGAKLKGRLYKDRRKRLDVKLSRLKAWHPDWRQMKVKVPLRKMSFGKGRDHYRWYVQTLWRGKGNCKRVCFDIAPNADPISEPL